MDGNVGYVPFAGTHHSIPDGADASKTDDRGMNMEPIQSPVLRKLPAKKQEKETKGPTHSLNHKFLAPHSKFLFFHAWKHTS
jgi:hypothetical protein